MFFFLFDWFSFSIAVSSLGVPLYASRSSAERFSLKIFDFCITEQKNEGLYALHSALFIGFLFYPRFLARRTLVRLLL